MPTGSIVPVPWTFTQLAPPYRPTLKLDGPNAPYGRPRRAPVAELELELRESETYYPGNDVPDRHVFGSKLAPIELAGRWMDSRIGVVGGAMAFAAKAKQFVDDKVSIRGEWGGTLAFTGLITKLKLSYESPQEIAWKITIKLDSDDTQPIQSPPAAAVSTTDLVKQVTAGFTSLQANVADFPPDITYQPGFLDSLASIISSINSYSAAVANFADSVDNFEAALASDVAHFRAGVAQYSSALDQFQITLGSAENDLGIAAAAAPSQTRYYRARAETDETLLELLAILAQCDLIAEIVLQGQLGTTYVAKAEDTWESIALALLGDAENADAIRQANGIRYGVQPLAGQQLHVPKVT